MKNNVIENIVNKVSIVDEISQYVNLTKKGQNNIGICPFHDDNNPSFTVNEDKKIFKCFVCGVGGNVIKFNQMWNKYTFAQAVIDLGEKYQIDVSSYKQRNMNNPLFDEQKNNLIQLNNNVNDVFLQMLSESEEPNIYLQSRKLSSETIKHFQIGYKNNSLDEIAQLLSQINVDYKTQQNSSLVTFTKDKIIDFFRDRITIPIKDEFNNIVGFGSRILKKDDNQVKYLNTKENPLFLKNELLFNLFEAKKDIYDNNKNSIIVVEGYMDVISLYNQNIKNVVAVMTNNITPKQVEKLISLKKQILLCLDFDSAGLQATFDFINKYPQANIKIVKLEKNLDPDEYINEYGRNQLIDNITNPLSVQDFLLELDSIDIEIKRDKQYNYGNLKPSTNIGNEFESNYYNNVEPPIMDDVLNQQPYFDSQPSVNEVVSTKKKSKTEVELISWIFEKQQKYLNEEMLKLMNQHIILSFEQKQLIRLEYSVFKWYINEQISKKRLLEYLQILNTNILKSWIIKIVEEDNSLETIKSTIKNSVVERYSEQLDINVFEIIYIWNNYNKNILAELHVTNNLKNDIINRSAINNLINLQRKEFFEKYRSLKH